MVTSGCSMSRHYSSPPPSPPARSGSPFDILKEIAERRAKLQPAQAQPQKDGNTKDKP